MKKLVPLERTMFSVLYRPGFGRIDQAGEHFSSLSGQLGTAALTVTDATLNSIAITMHQSALAHRNSSMHEELSDRSLLGISGRSAWSSTNVNIAAVTRELATSASA
jgi:hypothetical protein